MENEIKEKLKKLNKLNKKLEKAIEELPKKENIQALIIIRQTENTTLISSIGLIEWQNILHAVLKHLITTGEAIPIPITIPKTPPKPNSDIYT